MTIQEFTPPVEDESPSMFSGLADRARTVYHNPEVRAKVKEAAPRVGFRILERVGILQSDQSSGQRKIDPEGIDSLRGSSNKEVVIKVAKAAAMEVGHEVVHHLVSREQPAAGEPAGFEPTVVGADQVPMPTDIDGAPVEGVTSRKLQQRVGHT